jgi:2-methylcitrate dehydratase PrpD
MTQCSLSRHFSSFSISLSLDEVPGEVRIVARRAILDTLGVMIAGGKHPLVQALATGLPEAEGPCSVLGRGTGDAETAALVNGTAAHAWDFDDTSYTGIMHGSAVVLPVALALAEQCKAGEDDLMAAFIAGSEISYTLADICTHDHYFSGWWSTLTFGLIGATAAAARLLGLTQDQAMHAIGLAAASAGGGKAVFGTDGKAYLVGEAARRAIGFARAAKIGLTGPLQAFEDSRGFFVLLNKNMSVIIEAGTLGERWRLTDPGLLFKTSPVCSAAHAAIEQMGLLMDQVGAVAEDIISIKAEVPELVDISLVYPCPKNTQEAQFSLPYALACAVLHGRVLLEDLEADEITRNEKQSVMKKISTFVADDLSSETMRIRYPESARLTLSLADGRVSSGFCGEAYGMPQRPLSDKDLVDKFAYCLSFAGIPIPDQAVLDINLLELVSKLLSCKA